MQFLALVSRFCSCGENHLGRCGLTIPFGEGSLDMLANQEKYSDHPDHQSKSRTCIYILTWLEHYSLTKALLPHHAIWRDSQQGRVLVVLNFFHLQMIEATVLMGTFKAAEIFLYPSPDLCIETILSQRSTDKSFDFMLVLWSDMHC